MDFKALMEQAKRNVEANSSVASRIDRDLQQKEARRMKELQIERELKMLQRRERVRAEKAELEAARKLEEATKARKLAEQKAREQKRPKKDEPQVNPDSIAAYLARKELDKRKQEEEKKKQRDKLAELRLKANGGKASKKIARHFGTDPIKMQMKYGNDSQHIELLRKRKERELEEQRMLSDGYSTGINLAIEKHKKRMEEHARNKKQEETRRIGTSKANSLAGMSSRHAATRDTFSPPRDGNKATKTDKKPTAAMRAPIVAFDKLMELAREAPKESSPKPNSQHSALDINKQPRSAQPPSCSKVPVRKDFASTKHSQPDLLRKTSSVDGSVKKPALTPAAREDGAGCIAKAPPPRYPTPVPGRRILPGDIRYNAAMRDKRREDAQKSAKPGASGSQIGAKRSADSRLPSMPSPKKANMQRQMSAHDIRQRERERAKKYREAQRRRMYANMSLLERERYHEARKRRIELGLPKDLDEYEEEVRLRAMLFHFQDYYDDDSELSDDDFIDDEYEDNDFSYEALQESLRGIAPRDFDKRHEIWRMREKMIDDKRMESGFREVQAEERRSLRLGKLEDYITAQKGESEAL